MTNHTKENHMLIRLAAAAVLLLALVGCADTDTSTADEDVYDGTDNAALMDTVYLTALRNEYPEAFMAVEDDTLIQLGHIVCDRFEDGMSFESAALTALSAGYTPDQGGWLLGASITAYCPEFSYLMN